MAKFLSGFQIASKFPKEFLSWCPSQGGASPFAPGWDTEYGVWEPKNLPCFLRCCVFAIYKLNYNQPYEYYNTNCPKANVLKSSCLLIEHSQYSLDLSSRTAPPWRLLASGFWGDACWTFGNGHKPSSGKSPIGICRQMSEYGVRCRHFLRNCWQFWNCGKMRN
jgi:hypothetical protein